MCACIHYQACLLLATHSSLMKHSRARAVSAKNWMSATPPTLTPAVARAHMNMHASYLRVSRMHP